jgi:hypothetical protein
MPFQSQAQRKLFFAAADPKTKWKRLGGKKKPKISLAKAKEWAKETKNIKSLPEYKRARLKALNK